MNDKNAQPLTDQEIASYFADSRGGGRFPPILTAGEAAELAGVPIGTIYDWSSRGLLDNCAAKKGKRLRILRDRLVAWLFEPLNDKGD